MKLGPLSVDSIDLVFSDPWQSLHEEVQLRNCTIRDMKEAFLRFVGAPFSVSVMDSSGEVCAVIVMELIGKFAWYVHFAATQAGFERIWISLSRFMLKMTDHLVQHNSGSIQITSAAEKDSKTADWFDSMGFRYAGCDGDFHHYVKER